MDVGHSLLTPKFPAGVVPTEADYLMVVRGSGPKEAVYRYPLSRLSNSQTVVKTVDETIVNSSTLQNDNELILNLEAGTYAIEGFLHMLATGSAGIKANFAGTATLASYAFAAQAGTVGGIITADTSFNELGDLPFVILRGSLVCSVAGTLVLQWAQAGPDVGLTLTVYAGSFLAATRIG